MLKFFIESVNFSFTPTHFNSILELHYLDDYLGVFPSMKIFVGLVHLNTNFNHFPLGYIKTGFVLKYNSLMYYSIKEPILYV